MRYPPGHRDRHSFGYATPSEIYAAVERQQYAASEAFDREFEMTETQVPASQIANPMQYIDTDDPVTIGRYGNVNEAARDCYVAFIENCPQSAERTLAIRKLQEARMWANAAIAFDGRTYPL